MPRIPLQPLPPRAIESLEDEWLGALESKLNDPKLERADICRDTLLELSFPGYAGRYAEALKDPNLPVGVRLALSSCDPRNVTLVP
jgi:hypothetical protein